MMSVLCADAQGTGQRLLFTKGERFGFWRFRRRLWHSERAA